jgi:hypothetical protein
MSYDIDIKNTDGEPLEGSDINITFNLYEMLKAVSIDLKQYHDKPCKEIQTDLLDGLTLLLAHPKKFEKLNPENGYGSYRRLLDKLVTLNYLVRLNPDHIVKVDY